MKKNTPGPPKHHQDHQNHHQGPAPLTTSPPYVGSRVKLLRKNPKSIDRLATGESRRSGRSRSHTRLHLSPRSSQGDFSSQGRCDAHSPALPRPTSLPGPPSRSHSRSSQGHFSAQDHSNDRTLARARAPFRPRPPYRSHSRSSQGNFSAQDRSNDRTPARARTASRRSLH